MHNNTQFAEFSSNSGKLRGFPAATIISLPTNLGVPHHAAWRAFQAGMRVLQKYAGRSPGNSEAIAISNLQLLHRSLLKDPGYSLSLKQASTRTTTSTLPRSQCIFDDKGLRADLLTLEPGTTIQLQAHHDRCAMYLSIIGKPTIQSPDTAPLLSQHWWNHFRKAGHGKSLKNGDAVLISSQRPTKKLLAAKKRECVLLKVQLANG